MRGFVDVIELCGNLLDKDTIKACPVSYINFLSVRTVRVSPLDNKIGFVIDGLGFITVDEDAALTCVRKVIDLVTEIQETHPLEHLEYQGRMMGKTLRDAFKEEREAEERDKE